MRWERRRLQDFAANVPYAFVGGPFGSNLTSRDYVENGIPVIRGSNLTSGRFLGGDDFVYVTEQKAREELASNLAFPGDLIFTQRGTLGQVAIIPEESPSDTYVISQSQMKLTVDESKADKRFLYYYFTSHDAVQRILSFTSSSGVPHINLTVLRNFEVPAPPLATQARIADILSAYDDLIENNRRRIKLLEQAARLLYKEWFVHLRFPGHEHVKITNGVPEGWDRRKLVEVWNVSYGKNLPTANITEAGLYPVHGADQIIGYHTERNVYESTCLVTCRGAGSGNVRRTYGPTFVTNNCLILRSSLFPELLRFHFAMFTCEALKLTELRTGAAQPQLTIAGIANVLVTVPENQLLVQYNGHVDSILQQADTLRSQNERLTKARDLLLPRLMNGEISV